MDSEIRVMLNTLNDNVRKIQETNTQEIPLIRVRLDTLCAASKNNETHNKRHENLINDLIEQTSMNCTKLNKLEAKIDALEKQD